MPSISSWLSEMSRRKLRVAASGRDGLRDTINLRHFVLLKNSITQAESPRPFPSSSQPSSLDSDYNHTEVLVLPDGDTMIASLTHCDNAFSSKDSEEKWLESVLETLEDDLDSEVEAEIHAVEDDDDLDFLESASRESYESWVPPYDDFSVDEPLSISPDTFLSSTSSVLSPTFQPPSSVQLFFDSPHSPFNRPFVEPRYPEADFDLPISEASSDSESDDDDGPLTPYSGSQPSLEEQGVAQPEVYMEHDSYFLYPSELDPISPPIYYQQC